MGSQATKPAAGSLLDRWCHHLRVVRGLAENTIGLYRRSIVVLFGERVDVADLTPKNLEAALSREFASGRSSGTLRVRIAAARSLGAYLAADGQVPRNPLAAVALPKLYQGRPGSLTRPEVRRVVYGPRPGRLPRDPLAARNHLMAAVAYCGALRVGEVAGLRVADVVRVPDVDDARVLRIRHAKWASEDQVVYWRDAIVARLLAAYTREHRLEIDPESDFLFPSARRSGRAMATSTAYRAISRHLAGAKIRPRGRRISPHILRHSACTHLLQAGAEQRVVQHHMRHASISTTARYDHTSAREAENLWRKHHPLRPGRRAQRGFVAEMAEAMLGNP
ncbi:MAG: tyrosine-type recombinase/integrase [Acidobacteriota bacterium]